MFPSLSVLGITANATDWAANFDPILLVVVGIGVAFACTRFVKSLFF